MIQTYNVVLNFFIINYFQIIGLFAGFDPYTYFYNMASSSTSGIHSEGKYDVFINCRGLDTRRTFTCHLHKALVDNNINTYIDSNLDKGGEIAPALLKAIEESKIYVIIFSKRYASSAWCLDELVHIMKCKEGIDAAHVIPIFYDTKPADIRLQKDGYKLEKKNQRQD